MRLRPSDILIFTSLLSAGVSAGSAAPAIPNENAAIAIFKKQCGSDGGVGFGPYDQLDAHLEGGQWHVHARFPSAHADIDPLPRWKDLSLDIPVDGSPPQGKCYSVVTE
jgi:hypothetical protein